jgi:hypothetical protein
LQELQDYSENMVVERGSFPFAHIREIVTSWWNPQRHVLRYQIEILTSGLIQQTDSGLRGLRTGSLHASSSPSPVAAFQHVWVPASILKNCFPSLIERYERERAQKRKRKNSSATSAQALYVPVSPCPLAIKLILNGQQVLPKPLNILARLDDAVATGALPAPFG